MDLAELVLGDVGIFGGLGDAVVAHVGQALGVETAIASQVAVEVAAVYQLLFGEINCLALGESEGLEDGDCAEGPAGSALTLILDWRDHATRGPIHLSIHFPLLSLLFLNDNLVITLFLARDVHEIGGSELLLSQR